MKKLAILVTSLVLGASSVALATPSATSAYAPSDIRDHRNPGYGRWTPRPIAWSTLSSHSSLSARGRAVIDVSSRQRFTKLQLDANGSMFVDKVMIVFGNGQTQTVNLDARLMSRSAPLTIDLAGNQRAIDKVVVVGRGRGYRSSFALKAI
jgi:hypothetical protein